MNSPKHTKSSTLFNRYIWLVDTINNSGREGLTLKEINNKWLRNSMSDNTEIPSKTFHNHTDAIEEMFDIIITCNKSKNKYYINNSEDMERGGVRSWLLNTFAVNNLINESHKLKQRIIFEHIPSGQNYLTTIIEAMRDGLKLEMSYQSYTRDKVVTYPFDPYFVKVFKQRWYVIGKSDIVRIHALDRIKHLNITENTFELPFDFSPEKHFEDCFGIIHDESVVAQTIKIKVCSRQANYLRALPIHSSQREVEVFEGYVVFDYFVKPTFDFRQEILSMGDDVEVVSPVAFRKEIGRVARKMNEMYIGRDR